MSRSKPNKPQTFRRRKWIGISRLVD